MAAPATRRAASGAPSEWERPRGRAADAGPPAQQLQPRRWVATTAPWWVDAVHTARTHLLESSACGRLAGGGGEGERGQGQFIFLGATATSGVQTAFSVCATNLHANTAAPLLRSHHPRSPARALYTTPSKPAAVRCRGPLQSRTATAAHEASGAAVLRERQKGRCRSPSAAPRVSRTGGGVAGAAHVREVQRTVGVGETLRAGGGAGFVGDHDARGVRGLAAAPASSAGHRLCRLFVCHGRVLHCGR